MKKYTITKIIYAKSLKDAILKEKDAEIVQVELSEPLEKPSTKIGF